MFLLDDYAPEGPEGRRMGDDDGVDRTPLTVDDVEALAPMPLTRPGENFVPIRMQTEHLHVLEQRLRSLGLSQAQVDSHFLELHRLPPVPKSAWLKVVVHAYNAAVDER